MTDRAVPARCAAGAQRDACDAFGAFAHVAGALSAAGSPGQPPASPSGKAIERPGEANRIWPVEDPLRGTQTTVTTAMATRTWPVATRIWPVEDPRIWAPWMRRRPILSAAGQVRKRSAIGPLPKIEVHRRIGVHQRIGARLKNRSSKCD